MSETPTSLTFKYGLFGSSDKLKKGDIGFAHYAEKVNGTDVKTETGTLILKTPSDGTLLKLMPTPGSLGYPLVGQGESNSPKYDVLKLVGGGTGVSNLTNNRMLFVENSIFTTGNHYINENRIIINGNNEFQPNENLSILGTVRHEGDILVTGEVANPKKGGSISFGAICNTKYLRFNFGEIKAGAKGRMITVILKGNSYDASKMPYYSMYQFYYSSNENQIIRRRGQCFGAETGDLKLFRQTDEGKTYLRGVLYPPYNDPDFEFKTISIEIQYSWTSPDKMEVIGSNVELSGVTYEAIISPNFNPKTNSTLGAQQVLILGNDSVSGTGTNGMTGWLRLYGANTGYADIIGPPTTDSLAQKLPDRQGSIAVLDATDSTFNGKILFSSSLTDGTQVLTKTSHSVDATRLAINTALPNAKTDDSTLLVNGKTTVETLVISKAGGGDHILFSRVGLNYLVAPTEGSIAFCINSTAKEDKCPLIISANTLYPSVTNSISLGKFSNAWKQLYLTTTAGAWISGKMGDNTSAAAITFVTKQTSSSYHPMIATKTYSGNSVTYGGLKDTVGFYGYLSGTTDNKTDWSFTFNSANGNISATGDMSIGSITPKATNAHHLGSSTYIWNSIYNQVYRIYDASNKVSGGTLSTETNESTIKEKYTTLTLGNATASTAINNRTGRILLYGNGTTYSSIYASKTPANTRFTLPVPPASQTNYFAIGDSVGDAYRSTLLKPTVNTSILTYTANANSTAAFSWPSTLPGAEDSTKIAVWGERFAPTDVKDPGDIVMWLERKKGAAVNTLNVLIDGCFYQNGQTGFGKVLDSTGGEIAKLHITQNVDTDGTDSDASLVIGTKTATHMEIDTNEIQVKDGPTTAGPLTLQVLGGATLFGGNIRPTSDTTCYLGTSTNRWYGLYLGAGGINSTGGITTTGVITSTAGIFSSNTSAEPQVGVKGTSGNIYFYSHPTTNANAGIYYVKGAKEATVLYLNQHQSLFLGDNNYATTIQGSKIMLSSSCYGDSLPSTTNEGRIFFKIIS